MESNEATIQTEKGTSKLCRASTYCVIAAVGINLLFVIFAESPYQRMVDVGQKLEELPEVSFSNTNKPPNENQGLSNEEVDYLKQEAEKRMDIGIGGIIGLLKGSLLHLLIIVLSLLICTTGFILDIVDAVKNRKISTRNIVNAVVNVLCIFIVIPAITIAFILKGSELMWHFIAAILLLPLLPKKFHSSKPNLSMVINVHDAKPVSHQNVFSKGLTKLLQIYVSYRNQTNRSTFSLLLIIY